MKRLLLLLAVPLLVACASAPGGRSQLAPPAPLQGLSAVYSEFDMRLQLVTAADAPPCREEDCTFDGAFDQRILAIGQRLATAAYRQHPDLRLRFPRFEFVIADKRDPGTASSSGGTIVIYRGTRRLGPEDDALAFILAREMGHVIAGHHDENVTTSVLVSVAAQLLLPMLNVARGAVAAVTGNVATSAAATTVASSAVASAASMAGSRALRATYRPAQVKEAETVALGLLATARWDLHKVADRLDDLRPRLSEEATWTSELKESAWRIAARFQGPVLANDTLVADAGGVVQTAPPPSRETRAPF